MSPPFQTQGAAKDGNAQQSFTSKSDVPAAPVNTDVEGKASLQPKRTPVSDKEIEVIIVSKLTQRSSSIYLWPGLGRTDPTSICYSFALKSFHRLLLESSSK
ncbi:unnamed protein product [Ilex paraguariensis]|uniref:Uncharacterized protein n=1 Tax=Ilex paraguariensis TaxID=185542 RepID=A0ABC8RPC0_9AQUA